MTTHLVQRREQPLVTASDQGQKINTRDAALKNIGGKEKGDNMTKETKDKTLDEMSINELVETNAILNDNSDAVAKQLKTAHNYYDVKNFITVLTRFATSEVGANSKVIMVLPEGRNPMQKEFNIKEITLVENKIIGSREKYRCVILVQ